MILKHIKDPEEATISSLEILDDPLCFVFSYFCPLQMKNSTRNVSTINSVATQNIGDSYSTQPLRTGTQRRRKGESMMGVLYVLRLAKRNVSGQSDIEQ